MNTELRDFLKAINPIQHENDFGLFTKQDGNFGFTDTFGVKVFHKRVQKQWSSRRSWMWEMDNDGKRFCILPHKKWMFRW